MFPPMPMPPPTVDLTCFESLPDEDDEHLEKLLHQNNFTRNRYYVEEYVDDDSLVPNLQETYEAIPVVTSIYDGPLQDLFSDGRDEPEEKKRKQSGAALKSLQGSPQLRHQLDAAVTTVNIDHRSKSAMDTSGDCSFWRLNYSASPDTMLLDLLGGNSGGVDENEREVPNVGAEQRHRCSAREQEQLVPDWYIQSEE